MRVLLTVFILLISGPVSAQTIDLDFIPIERFPVQDVNRLSVILSNIHELPSRSELEKTTNANDIVLALANSGNDLVRDRALVALSAYWPSGDVFLLMARVIANPQTRFATRLKTMLAMGSAFGDRAHPVLLVYLRSDDLQLQITAVQAIGKTPTGFEILTTHLDADPRSEIVAAIQKYGRRFR